MHLTSEVWHLCKWHLLICIYQYWECIMSYSSHFLNYWSLIPRPKTLFTAPFTQTSYSSIAPDQWKEWHLLFIVAGKGLIFILCDWPTIQDSGAIPAIFLKWISDPKTKNLVYCPIYTDYLLKHPTWQVNSMACPLLFNIMREAKICSFWGTFIRSFTMDPWSQDQKPCSLPHTDS